MSFLIPLAVPLIEQFVESVVKGSGHDIGRRVVDSFEGQSQGTFRRLSEQNQSQTSGRLDRPTYYRKHHAKSRHRAGRGQSRAGKRHSSRYR